MELSILVARILSVTYLAVAAGMLSGRISFEEIINDFERSPGLVFLTGFITVTLGVILVTYHNRWDGGWPVVVTVIGWIALIKGIMLLAIPKIWISFKKNNVKSRVWGFSLLCLGFLLGYFGFMH